MLTVSDKGGSPREPIPAKIHVAVCNSVIDLGVQTKTFNNETKQVREVLIGWELPYETIEVEEEKVPRVISRTYSMSLHEKSKLRKDLESWMGRKLTAEEAAGFNLTTLLGKPCQLQVIHVDSNGRTYANINNIVNLPDNMPVPSATQVTSFDLDAPDAKEIIVMLPEWIQNKIKESSTWEEMEAKAAQEDLPF